MKSKTVAAAAALAIGVCAGAAGAEEFWGSASDWDIYAEPGVGCFIERNEPNGAMRIGLDANSQTGFFAVMSPNFNDVVDGEVYDIQFALDGQVYDGTGEAFVIDGVYGYHVEVDNESFIFDLATRYTLEMYDEGVSVVRVDLNGSNQALGGAAECADSM